MANLPKRLLLAVVLVLALGACTPSLACRYPLPSGGGGAGSTEEVVFGDSLGAQILALTNDGRTWHVNNGASLADWSSTVDQAIARRPAAIAFALGSNEALEGWDGADASLWRSKVDAARSRGICVVAVLPHFQPAAESSYPGSLAEVEEARSDISGTGARIADWRPVVQAHPEIIGPDGIHLLAFGGVNAAVQARYDLVDGALEGCG